ncbi:MAG TPA: NAD(P)/FAD-dependent oxidoreductase [Phycisphaerae bacterium]|nr:NAD(P)/FAD-dependent oxidoreductase [Phycisphaerae bacterium]HRY68848.1 NAD(P)/FAD-dependent oxidoreductase [Phycisphaerae bacterium]HSA27513.1 NAD(P)/FAD-dependent oxidoreductase [Phycisphaerae bacterium]
MDQVDVVIVGAGAAGLATAIFAGRQLPGRSMVVLDGSRRPGAKILVAGGGRCNLTNRAVTSADFNGTSRHIIRNVLAAFPVEQTVAFFREIGVDVHEEEDGKLFPDSNQARTVLDALVNEVGRRGVRLWPEHRVTALARGDSGFTLATNRGGLSACCVVLATGGLSLPKTGSDGGGYELARGLGHTLVPTTPALVPLVLDGEFHRPLSGLSQDVGLALAVEGRVSVSTRGAMLWTHFGVSGPAVLDISRHWHRAQLDRQQVVLTANLLPGEDLVSVENRVIELARQQPKQHLRNVLTSWLPARLVDAVLASLGIGGQIPLAHLARDLRRRLLSSLLQWPLPVRESRGYAHAEVTAGGIPLNEIHPATMQSRLCPGLFLAGEILDVDGRIGGFNFQWAWSSAAAAGAGLRSMFGVP